MKPPVPSTSAAGIEECVVEPLLSPRLTQRALVSSTKKPAVPACRPPWLMQNRFDCCVSVEVFET